MDGPPPAVARLRLSLRPAHAEDGTPRRRRRLSPPQAHVGADGDAPRRLGPLPPPSRPRGALLPSVRRDAHGDVLPAHARTRRRPRASLGRDVRRLSRLRGDRANGEHVFVYAMLFFVLLILGIADLVDPSYTFPLFGPGIPQILRESFLTLGFFGEPFSSPSSRARRKGASQPFAGRSSRGRE